MQNIVQSALKHQKYLKQLSVQNKLWIGSRNPRHFSVCNVNNQIGLSQGNFLQNLGQSVMKRINIFDYSETKLKVSGYLLYESIADNISYGEFFQKYNLPDTFYSWFAVTELHIWILSVRVMAEGEDGKTVRNAMMEAMWTDVQKRSKKLGSVNSSNLREQVNDLSEQFHAALIGYDEGLLSNDDCVLAGALWRRCYQRDCNSAENLDHLVQYVRQQILLFDNLSRNDILTERKVTWPKQSKLS